MKPEYHFAVEVEDYAVASVEPAVAELAALQVLVHQVQPVRKELKAVAAALLPNELYHWKPSNQESNEDPEDTSAY